MICVHVETYLFISLGPDSRSRRGLETIFLLVSRAIVSIYYHLTLPLGSTRDSASHRQPLTETLSKSIDEMSEKELRMELKKRKALVSE